jgi:hypothetical protein
LCVADVGNPYAAYFRTHGRRQWSRFDVFVLLGVIVKFASGVNDHGLARRVRRHEPYTYVRFPPIAAIG